MNKYLEALLNDVADNNLNHAKQDIRNYISTNKNKSNQEICEKVSEKLNRTFSEQAIPSYLSGILVVEDCSDFNEERYLLTSRECELLHDIRQARYVNEKLQELNVRYLNTTLLYGESGTGKTTFGRFLAYKLGVPFCYLNFAKIVNSAMGKTAENIAMVFEYVKQCPDCVFMLDELDAIGCKRVGNNENVSGEMNRTVISLMQSMDTLDNNIIILGATNRKDMIDEALIRRFTRTHLVESLTDDEARHLVDKYFADIGMEITPTEKQDIIDLSEHKACYIVQSCNEVIIDKLEQELWKVRKHQFQENKE